MADVVHGRAREIGSVCSIKYPLPREEVEQHGNCKFYLFRLGYNRFYMFIEMVSYVIKKKL